MGFKVCKARFDDAWASPLYHSMDRNQSFLWTIVREPSERAISQLLHFHVPIEHQPSTDESLVSRIRNETGMFSDYYLSRLSSNRCQRKKNDPVQRANEILQQYDFIAIMERMDESIVALSMLLKLPLADVLYLTAKDKRGYDDTDKKDLCEYIEPAFISDGLRTFSQTKEYQDMVRWDSLLYQAANKSLDLTIEALGREKFARNLSIFRQAQEEATTRCILFTRFPCSENRTLNKDIDCLWKDSECGLDCLDQVSNDLDLW